MATKGEGTARKDRGAPEAAAEAPQAKSGKRKLLLIVLAVAVLLAAGGAGVVFSGILGPEAPPAAESAQADPQASTRPKPAPTTVFHPLPDLVISLGNSERRTAFLKLRLTIEVASAADIARIESLMPRVIDYCQLYLRELRHEDLAGSAGTFRLKEELMRRINAAVAPTEVLDVLLSELLIQ